MGEGAVKKDHHGTTNDYGWALYWDIIRARKACWRKTRSSERDAEFVRSVSDDVFGNINRQDVRSMMCLLRKKPFLLIEMLFTIVDKNGATVPFFLNEVQREFIASMELYGANRERPYVILKGRQQGFTSLITAISLSFMIMRENFTACTIADDSSKTIDLFEKKGKQVFDRIADARWKPAKARDNLNQLSFADKANGGNMSSWRVRVASPEVERGQTIQLLHCSEVATFPCLVSDMQAGAIESVVPDGYIFYESTANGYNQFRDLWNKKTNICLFFEWWRTREYRKKDTSILNDLSLLELSPGELNWLTERLTWLASEKKLDDEQLAWYATKYASYVNPEKIKQEYPCTANEAFLASGNCVFPTDAIVQRQDEVERENDYATGYFVYEKRQAEDSFGAGGEKYEITGVKFVSDPNGYITIHKPPECRVSVRNESGESILKDAVVEDAKKSGADIVSYRPYSIGGDTAGQGSDYFTAKVVDNLTGEECASLRIQNMDDDLYADQLYCLGVTYNTALIAIEMNFSYEPTKELLRLDYPKVYVRESVTDESGNSKAVKFGWQTSISSRPVIIAEFKTRFRKNPKIIHDKWTLSEMMTFIRDDKGKETAAQGEHDDTIMALMIAEYVSSSYQSEHEYQNMLEREPTEFEKFIGADFTEDDDCDGIPGYATY